MMHEFGKIESFYNNVDLLGAKGHSLGILFENGFVVPKGFIIDSNALHTEISEELCGNILSKYDELGFELVAVRSSSNVEDSLEKSFAGQFDSFLRIGKDEIIESIKKCVTSAYSRRINAYVDNSNPIKMAVIIQEMIQPDFAGVAFNINPVDRNNETIVIETVKGSGESLVQGAITPDFFEVNRNNFTIINRSYSQDCKITDAQVIEIANLTQKVSIFFKYQADIEWAIARGVLYLLQSRPITTV